jgi:VCBS repeat-containing protein
MANNIQVLVNTGNPDTNKTFEVLQGSGKRNKPTVIKAFKGARYQLEEQTAKSTAPEKIRSKRVGKNLHVMLDGSKEADLIIENYYDEDMLSDNNRGLYGRAEDGKMYEYIPEDPTPAGLPINLAEGGRPVSQVLGGLPIGEAFELSGLVLAAAGGGFGLLGAGAAVVGGAALAGGGGGGDAGTDPAAAALASIKAAAENNTATSGNVAVSVFTAAGVTGVTADNLAAIQSALDSAAVNGNAADTKEEVQAIVDAYNAIKANAAGTAENNATNPTQAQYAAIGVTGVDTATEESLLGDAIDGKSFSSVDTVPEVQTLADAVAAVMTGAAGGTAPTKVQLEALGITGVTDANLSAIQAAIAAIPDNGTGVDTLSELQAVANTGATNAANAAAALSAIASAAQANNATTSNLAASVFATAGVTGVTTDNLAAIQSALDSAAVNGTSADTLPEVQAIVDAYNAIKANADGTANNNATNPTQAQYAAIGVTGLESNVKASLLGDVVDSKLFTAVDSVPEVQALADAAAAVMTAAAGTAGGNGPTRAQLEALGITGVTDANLAAVQASIARTADDGIGVDTQAELQAVVTIGINEAAAAAAAAAAAIAAISAAAQANDASNTNVATSVFVTAGVTGVNSTNVAAIQSALNSAAVNGVATDTLVEIQNIVNAYNAIRENADGTANNYASNPTQAEYALIGVTGVDNDEKVSLLGDAIDGKPFTAVDSVGEVQALADAAAAVMTGAAGGTAPTLAQLQALGITGVTAENLAAMQAAIAATPDDGKGVDRLSELQALVSQANDALAKIENYNNGNGTEPAALTPEDYAAAGITGVTAENLAAVNAAVLAAAAGEANSVAEVQALVTAGNNALAKIENYNNGNGTNPAALTPEDYAAAGVTGVAAENLAAVNAAVLAAAAGGANSVAEVQNLIDTAAAAQEAARLAISAAAQANNANGTTAATSAQYAALGVTGVDDTNLAAINSALNSSGVDGEAANSTAEVQAIVDAYKAILAKANSASATNPTQEQYVAIGVTGVNNAATSSLLGDAIDGKDATDVNTVEKVQALANAAAAVTGATAGGAAPSSEQLALLGLTGVNPQNLAAIQAAIASSGANGSGTSSLASLQSLIDNANDIPVVSSEITSTKSEGDASYTVDLLVGATDADAGETETLSLQSVMYAVDGGAASTSIPTGLSLAADGKTLTVDPTDAVFNSLAVGQSQVIVVSYQIKDVHGATVSQTATITVTGTNDVAVIGTPTVSAVTEDVDVASANLTATGTISVSDADQNQSTFNTTVSSAATNLGSLVLAAGGGYTYTVANAAVQYLGASDTKVDTFMIKSADGTSKDISFTVNGTNDVAVISGTKTGAVLEAGGVANAITGTPTATGTLTSTDIDGTANAFTAVAAGAASAGGYGTYEMTAAGAWTYTLDNTKTSVQALTAGQQVTDTFTVTAADGTAQVLSVTVTGANDAAVISGTKTGAVVEAGGVANATTGTPTATGTLTSTDIDGITNAFTAVTTAAATTGGYGTYVMTAAGAWTYTLNNSNTTVQLLNASETLNDTFTVTAADGTTQVVTVTITGSNDSPTVVGSTFNMNEDVSMQLVAEFKNGYSDADGDAQESVKIVSLPNAAAGILKFNGNPVTVDQVISLNDIILGKVVFATIANYVGPASFKFSALDTSATNNTSDPVTVNINVIAVNDAPVLSTNSPITYSLPATPVAGLTPSTTSGMLVKDLISTYVSDVDGATVPEGIAVTFVDFGRGTLWYSLNGTWTQITTDTINSSNALLLGSDADNRVFFQPIPNSVNMTPQTYAIKFRAWDQTTGTEGSYANTSSNGVTTAFSTAEAWVNQSYTNVAPVLETGTSIIYALPTTPRSGSMPTGATGMLVKDLIGTHISDSNGSTVPEGIAITFVDTSRGTLWYSTTGGSTWAQVPSTENISNAHALLLGSDADNRVFFQPTPGSTNTATINSAIRFRAWDQTWANVTTPETTYANIDTIGTGSNTPFSTAEAWVSLAVSPVVIDANRDGMLSYSQVTMDVDGDGHLDQTAWAASQDGVLVWDKLGDAKVHDNSQYAFSQYGAAGSTDLQGLAAGFDTNHDGVFNAADAQFDEFKVWQDANQNGVSDAGEVRSLADLGIESINLTSDGVVRTPAEGVTEAGQTTATATDGSSVLVSDAGFAYNSLAYSADTVAGLGAHIDLLGSDMHLDLSSIVALHSNVAAVDLTGTGANSLKLNLSDVLGTAATNGVHTLTLTGDANDTVDLNMNEWTNTGTTVAQGEHTYAVYNASSAAAAQLLIDQHMVLANHG